MKLLLLGKDGTVFRSGVGVSGDARQRHMHYARLLRERYGPGAEIRVITYTTAASRDRFDAPVEGLRLYGTASLHRATYIADATMLLPKVLARGWRPDAIATQTPWEEGALGAALARRLDARFYPQVHFELFSSEWLSEKPLNRWRLRQAERILRRATRVRAVSEPLKAALVGGCGIDADRIDVIPVGVNFVQSAKTRGQAKAALGVAGRPVVLFVGRLTAAKNLSLWLEVAAAVRSARPDVLFVVAGGGEEAAPLQALAQRLGLAEVVRFLGAIPYEDLPDLFAAADVFLLTSQYEGFGRVVLEAALAGVPTVSTRCAGPEDLIEDGRTGCLAARGDISGLASATLGLLDAPGRRAQMGAAARELASLRYGFESLAERLMAHWAAE